MTQEDRKLLLTDLCARLPYNVYIYFKTRYRCNAITDMLDGAIYTYIETHLLEDDGENEIDIIKPYLRPMSSMTEEEKDTYDALTMCNTPWVVNDWLNKKMLDYRGLIEKGLALEAPEVMYKHFGDMDVIVTSVEHKDKL